MEKDFATYALIKGLASTGNLLGLNQSSLCVLIAKPTNINPAFFKRIEEMLKCSVETMGIDLTAEYFSLSKEVIEAVISGNKESAFLVRCKEAMQEINTAVESVRLQQAEKQISNRRWNSNGSAFIPLQNEGPVSNLRRGSNGNSEGSAVIPQQDEGHANNLRRGSSGSREPVSLHNTESRTERRKVNHQDTSALILHPISSSRIVPMHGFISNASLASLPEHVPVRGNIYSPDYSYSPRA